MSERYFNFSLVHCNTVVVAAQARTVASEILPRSSAKFCGTSGV